MDRKIFFILVTVCVITHIVRLIYEILKHKKLIVPGKLSFIIILTDMILLWISWCFLCSFDPYKMNLYGVFRYSGALLACAGLILFISGFFTIKTLESYEGNLITTGIYSIIRHPMYLGFILWLIGFPLYFDSLFSLMLSFVFIVNVISWRYFEERELEKRFSSYFEYRKTTLF